MTMQINDPKTQGLKSVTPIQAGMLIIQIQQFRSLAADHERQSQSRNGSPRYRAHHAGQAYAWNAAADAIENALR